MEKNRGLQELCWMAGVATCIKLLLIPTYHSTDFEVHRNWLAVTGSLPLNRWYLDETSEWTLDYPPFFAWFEYALSFFARILDPIIVDINQGLNYNANTVVLFQRISVIVSDIFLYWGLWKCVRSMPLNQRRIAYIAVLFSPGLLMVDHIHFQYNGFLLGILFLSLSYLRDGNDLLGGICFAILLCFKHLFAVAAPVYFIYLLRHYCTDIFRFLKLGSSVIFVALAAFGPFLYYGQMDQVLGRLFPFGRGLSHAYWAPNFWALYNTADKVLAHSLKMLGFPVDIQLASMTGGLVGDQKMHTILPKISPSTTMLLVLLALLPCMSKLWKKARKEDVLFAVAYAYNCGYMFGWHVHEKACLHFLIPISLGTCETLKNAREYFFLSIVSYYSLFPLLYEPREYPIKVILLVLHILVMWVAFSAYFKYQKTDVADSSEHSNVEQDELHEKQMLVQLLGNGESLYIFGLALVELYGQVVHNILFKERLAFLPLMMISCYSALGMLYIWTKQFMSMCKSM